MDWRAAIISGLVTVLVGILGWAAVDMITQVDSNKAQISALGSRITALEKSDEQHSQRLDLAIDRIIQMMAGNRERENKKTTWPQTP